MKWIKKWGLFRESLESKNVLKKNPIDELCVAMCLINPNFLDNILDRGLKARYSENSSIFLSDLKSLLLSKNRLVLGKLEADKIIEDVELSKLNLDFSEYTFDIDKDWKKLHNWRTTARSICDKLLPDEKLVSDMIKKVYWIGPNRNSDIGEDLVIELENGRQYSIFLDKNPNLQKTSSFNSIIDILIGEKSELLFSEEFMKNWDKLARQFLKITYEGVNKNIQAHIEKFIDYSRIDTITYFSYFDIKHSDPKYKNLGEYFKEYDKNILKLSDLLNEIWKSEKNFFDYTRVLKEWNETKIVVLNSRILEHLITKSFKDDFSDEIKKLDSGLKLSSGKLKMKFIKLIVEKLGCLERDIYHISSNGLTLQKIPSREFFRDNYDDLELLFDYHVYFKFDELEPENNNFNIKTELNFKGDNILKFNISVSFRGGEFSDKLNSKSKFELPSDFNYKIDNLN